MGDGWANFFVLLGTASAGLMGLLFVVVTLTSGFDRTQAMRGARLYLTPTALHFSVVLSVSAVGVTPGLPMPLTAGLFCAIALVGFVWSVTTSIGIRRPSPGGQKAHWTDFWMYGATPAIVYLALAVAGGALWAGVVWAAQVLAGLLLGLLLIGIRNAWDLITWIAPMRDSPPAPPPSDPTP